MAKHCDLKAKELIHFIGNAHIYDDHVKALTSQISIQQLEPPKLEIKEKNENINDYKFNDFNIVNYKHSNQIKMNMRA